MLYFIKSLKYLKIGYSLDFETLVTRMESYITHNPNFVLISFTEFGTKKDEKILHNLLKDFQYYTEWFIDNIQIYNIWREYVEKENLIPKNCFYQFPEDIKEFKNLNYREVLNSPLIPDFLEEGNLNIDIEKALLKYFGKNNTFTPKDFKRVCLYCEKELGKKVNKLTLEKFGYIFNLYTDKFVTVFKENFIFI